MKTYLGICASLLATTAIVAPSSAAVVATTGNYTFTFQGVCTDCQGFATATLLVQNYSLGAALTLSNFVSFTYSGTNLAPAFTLNSVTSFSGNLNLPIAFYQVYLSNGIKPFSTDTSGNWQLGSPAADYGTNGTFAGSPTTRGGGSTVPEPASWAMMLAGFGLLGVAMRRRRVTVSFA